MKSPIDRLLQIIELEKMSATSFSKAIGKNSSYISNIKRSTASFSVDVLITINELFPNYCVNWIVTGQGNMLCNEGVTAKKDISVVYADTLDIFKKNLLDLLEDVEVIAKLKLVLQ